MVYRPIYASQAPKLQGGLGQGGDEHMQNGFEWRGMDGAGFYSGFYKERGRQYRLDIAVPSAGSQTKTLRQHEILIDGELVHTGGPHTVRCVEDAKQFLLEYFNQGLHKGRAPCLQEKLFISAPSSSTRRSSR